MLPTTSRVLLVEDSAVDREAIKLILANLGYKNIVEAVDGIHAIGFLTDPERNTPPVEFVISDWRMAKMSGMDFLKLVRADENLKRLPFILISTVDDMSEVLNAIVAGVTDYIVKPITADVLKKKMLAAYLKMSPLPRE